MRARRAVDPEVADMTGAAELPRRSGDLVFHEPWERRAFALAVALNRDGQFEWEEFRQNLISAMELGQRKTHTRNHRRVGYYEQWLTALEQTLDDNGIIISGNRYSTD